jgi:hypothetical protein
MSSQKSNHITAGDPFFLQIKDNRAKAKLGMCGLPVHDGNIVKAIKNIRRHCSW